MRNEAQRGLILAAVVLLVIASAGFAQTTGRIQGRVIDDEGAALPGVVIEATSSSLQGSRMVATDESGSFRFLNLPPGTYVLTANLEGFNTLEQREVRVGLDRTVTLELEMSAAFTEVISVTSESPVVDITSSSAGLSLTSETFNQIPLARDFYAVAQVAAGTGQDDSGTTFYGSTGAENQYVIDGLNTTGVELGTEGKTLNFEFIAEVETKTAGLPAEYGRMTGGFVNAITKSGGNEFHGDVFGYFEGGSLQSDDSTKGDRPATTTQVVNVDSKQDFGVDLGGYILQDKLWFFAAYDRVDETRETEIIQQADVPGSPAEGDIIDADITSDLYAGKLTWKINAQNNFSLSIFGDPSTREGNVFTISGPPPTWEGTRDTGSDDYVARYDGVFGGNWVLEALVGRHQEEDAIAGPGKDIPRTFDFTVVPTGSTGGFSFHQDQEFERDLYRLDVSNFVGDHELKVGVDREDIAAVNANWNGGAGQRIYKFETSDGLIYYRHRFYVDDTAPGFVRDDPSSWVIAAPLVSEPETINDSIYAQDRWQVLANLTLSFGVRLEQQEVKGRGGVTAFEIDDNWSPRVGFSWDVKKNGRSKLYGNYGRYYESVPMDINIRAFGGEIQCFCYNFDPDPSNTLPDDTAPRRSGLLGGSTEPVDPGLKGQYVDEYLLGYEYEVRPNLALGAQVLYRDLGRVIEDFLVVEEGNYFIANPGEGQFGQSLTFYDYSTVPAPSAAREFTSIELSARKRFSDNWQLIANYVWSELEGNYDGLFQASTGQLDPNINSAFDYADFLVNADGKLSNDRTHQIKVAGNYRFSEGPVAGLNVGLRAFWLRGTPLTAYGYSFAYNNWEYYLTPRGSIGRNPDFYEADLHLSYPVKIGDRMELNLLFDVFNLLDRQAIYNYDQRYNLAQDDACAGIPADICNDDGGLLHQDNSLEPVGQLSNPRATATNPDFLRKGIDFTGQRNIRFGVRLTF